MCGRPCCWQPNAGRALSATLTPSHPVCSTDVWTYPLQAAILYVAQMCGPTRCRQPNNRPPPFQQLSFPSTAPLPFSNSPSPQPSLPVDLTTGGWTCLLSAASFTTGMHGLTASCGEGFTAACLLGTPAPLTN
eukprot:6914-Chlamydomonas_euryale.AAC.1